jgi:hypothetical protein
MLTVTADTERNDWYFPEQYLCEWFRNQENRDVASIAAIHEFNVDRKMLVCLGFGVDRYHGVSNALTLEAVADLTRYGGVLGILSLLADMPEVKKYRTAARFVFKCMPHGTSIFSSSILSALEGRYGNVHATARTRGNTLWINPLMSVYWCFRLESIADRILYLDWIKNTQSYADIGMAIAAFRQTCEGRIRHRHSIPD